MEIKQICDKQQKISIATSILAALPEWFGIPESTQEYIDKSAHMPFFVVFEKSKPLGFISLKENNCYTTEIYVMGVLPSHHKQGIGRNLTGEAIKWARSNGYEYLQVKTLDASHPDVYYADTRKFYLSMGFKPLECIPDLWGKENPCLIMIQFIGK